MLIQQEQSRGLEMSFNNLVLGLMPLLVGFYNFLFFLTTDLIPTKPQALVLLISLIGLLLLSLFFLLGEVINE